MERDPKLQTEMPLSAHQIGKHFKDGKHPVLISVSVSKYYSCTVGLIASTFHREKCSNGPSTS